VRKKKSKWIQKRRWCLVCHKSREYFRERDQKWVCPWCNQRLNRNYETNDYILKLVKTRDKVRD